MTRLAIAAIAAFVLCCSSANAGTTVLHYGPGTAEVLTIFPQAGAGHRVVVLVHGGGWREQKLETEDTSYAEALQRRLSATIVDVNYPQRAEYGSAFPEEPRAVERATEWTEANVASFGGDRARLSMVGLSAGGHLATLAAQRLDFEHPGTVRAVVSSSGPMDLRRLLEEEATFGMKVAFALGCRRIEGCSLTLGEEWSPRSHIEPSTCPPELLATYQEDKVPSTQAEEMSAALSSAGCVSKLVVVPGSGHVPGIEVIGTYPFLEAWGG